MSCEKYRTTITEALASGEELPPNVQSHVHGCSGCRAVLAREEALLTAIDNGIRNAVHCEVPGSFQAAVRARIREEAMPKANWVRTWAAVAASAALLLGVVVMRSIWHSGVSRNSKPTTLVRSHWPQQKTANPPLATRLPRAAESPRTARQQSRERDQSQSGVFVGEARTLLPAGQRWAIDGLISGLQRGELKGEILLRETWNGQIEDLQIPPIEIPALPAVSADEGIR